MADWAAALAGGIGAAANTGAGIIGDQMKQQQALDAEQRAADIKLDLAQRMAAADEMMKNRAAERFSQVVKQKAGEEVPVEAQGVDKTGITRDAGKAVGYVDVNGTQVAGSFQMAPADLKQKIAKAQANLADPNLSAEARADNEAVLALLQKQIGAQAGINAKAVDGKTRKRTTEEAMKAALPEVLGDAAASAYGTGMLSAYGKLDDADQKMEIQKRQIEDRLKSSEDRTAMMGQIAQIRLEAAQAVGGKSGQLPSDAKMIQWLIDGGMDRQTATDRVLGTGAGATKDPVAMATSLASSMISSGVISKKKGEDENEFLKRAMSAATGQIQSAEGMFRPGRAAPAPAAAGMVSNPVAAPGKPKNDPLGLFK